ncbi:MAG: NADH dehydrogenase [Cellvibrionaceae bacterium]
MLQKIAAGTINASHDEKNYFIYVAQDYYEFQLGSMINLDRTHKKIILSPIMAAQNRTLVNEGSIGYDILITTVGSTCSDFGPLALVSIVFILIRVLKRVIFTPDS